MLWKVHFFDKRQDSNEENRGNFGFKSPNTPSFNDYIKPSQDELYSLLKKIEFRQVNNCFLNEMKEDIKKMKKTSRVVVFADKTTNAYAVEKDAYNKLLREYITKDYKKSRPSFAKKHK